VPQTLKDPSRFRDPARTLQSEIDFRTGMDRHIQESAGSYLEKFENFPNYLPRQALARFLALYEIFKLVLPVQGDVIECGVNWGGGLMGFALMSAVLEPANLQRRIAGFDTFAGFREPAKADHAGAAASSELRAGGLAADSCQDLLRSIRLFDSNRMIGHIEKVTLVQGDATQTIPEYLKRNPHTVVSLLHLDFDLYEPTIAAINNFLPRMPGGAIIVFDELNNRAWPGETVAVQEAIGIRNLRISRFPFEPHISYAVLE
jgi:Macrocin-O-methyltransferase (TylF)